jgi:hypothetical protein
MHIFKQLLRGIIWLFPQLLLSQNNVDLSNIKGQLKEKLAAKPLEINGGVQLNSMATFGTTPTPQPLSYILSGNLLIKVFGYDMPFSFNYSNKKFSNTNPSFSFNRTAFNPKYKNWQGHFGDITMTFSPYTLAGFQFTGVGLSYQSTKLQSQIFYGRFLKGVAEDTLTKVAPSFKRLGTGIKLQYSHNKYKIGTAIFYAQEDAFSIPIPIMTSTIKPMENIAISFNIGLPITDKITLESEISTSVLTKNVLKNELAENKGDALKYLLKYNNISTNVYYAVKTNLNYTISKNDQIALSYERVDPDYQTLGGYFFTNDFENITINAQHKGKLNATLSTGLQRDDIKDQKQRNAGRMVVSSNLSFKVTEGVNVNFNYSNFQSYAFIRTGFERINRLTPFDNLDTLGFSQLSQNMGLNIQNTIKQDSEKVQLLMANFTHVTTANRKGNSTLGTVQQAGGSTILTTLLTYNHTLVKQDLSVGVGVNYAINSIDTIHINMYGPTLNVAKQLFEKKLGVNGSLSYNYTDKPISNILTLNIGANSTLRKLHNITFNATLQYRSSPHNVQFNAMLGYAYTFQNYAPKIKFLEKLIKKEKVNQEN